MIADDSPDVRELWNLWLTSCGFVVEEACDGADALRKVRSFRPDLVLMDVCMPVMDGLRATERLRADPLTAHLPILAVSADVCAPAPQQALDAGCDVFLSNLMSPQHLLHEVRAALRKSVAKATA